MGAFSKGKTVGVEVKCAAADTVQGYMPRQAALTFQQPLATQVVRCWEAFARRCSPVRRAAAAVACAFAADAGVAADVAAVGGSHLELLALAVSSVLQVVVVAQHRQSA